MTSTDKARLNEPSSTTDYIEHRPSVVALGGGHGLAATLRAARSYAGVLTGIVSIGDDGGSSGRLRSEFGVAPPGDVRRCLSALATNDSLLTRSLEHRFVAGTLEGHAIGNLLLTGLAMVGGDLQAAIDEVGRLTGAAGRIFPATQVPVILIADSDEGALTGQVTIERASGITNLRFDPVDPPVSAAAVSAVRSAEQILIGPGSLFTSVLATAVVPAIREALNETRGQRVFIANVTNEKGEARGFGLPEHLDALTDHGLKIDAVIAPIGAIGGHSPACPVLEADVAADDGWSHDPAKLGPALAQLYHERL